MSFGDNLKRLRRDIGLTQSELADKCGIRYGHISKIERNIGDPKLSTVYKLMNALDVSSEALLMDEDKIDLNGIASIVAERISSLPDDKKEHIIDVIDNYCGGIGLKSQLEGVEKGIWLNWKGATKDILPEKEKVV